MRSTTPSPRSRTRRRLAVATTLAATMLASPAAAHAQVYGGPPAGVIVKHPIGGEFCAAWESTGDAWVYIGVIKC